MVNYLLRRSSPSPVINYMPPELLLFGEDTQDYDVHAVSASAVFQF